MAFVLGSKVIVGGHEGKGFGEVFSYPDAGGKVRVIYYKSPEQYDTIDVPEQQIQRTNVLPLQTRCYFKENNLTRIGRVVNCRDDKSKLRTYYVQFPNEPNPKVLKEDEFNVRSYLGPADPVQTLISLGHETPFFFESRNPWFASLTEQLKLSHELYV